MVTTPLLLAIAALVLATGAEWLHLGRVRSVAALAFGPGKKAALAGKAAPFIRIAGLAALIWGLATLMILPPAAHRSVVKEVEPKERQHLLLVLDVSPSMRLRDAGPRANESRMARARLVVESIIARTAHDKLHTTVIAVYNGAKAVVEETRDLEILHNLMDDLPMHQAFPSGKTKLLDGLTEATRIAAKWPRGSATLVLISDGDSVPATGNTKLVPTAMLQRLGTLAVDSNARLPGQRELAIFMTILGASLLAGLPLLLHFAGSRWNPGPNRVRSSISRSPKLTASHP